MRPRRTPQERKERRQQMMRRSKFALPSIVTMASVFCGFSSVIMALNAAGPDPEANFRAAAAFLVGAAIFDALDGRVARATNTATEFGVQLDSLADVVSFGMAPAILAYRYGFFALGLADPNVRAVGWAACFVFIACGALRLARFNVQVGHVDPRFFVGLPIPAGAACVASVILCWPTPPATTRIAYAFAAELFLVALLMVSTVRFPSFKKRVSSPRAAMAMNLAVVLLLALLIMFRERFLVGFFATFVLAGILMNLAWKLGWRGVPPPLSPEELESTVH